MNYTKKEIKSAIRKVDLKTVTLQKVTKKPTPFLTEIRKAQKHQKIMYNKGKKVYRVCIKLDDISKKTDFRELGKKLT